MFQMKEVSRRIGRSKLPCLPLSQHITLPSVCMGLSLYFHVPTKLCTLLSLPYFENARFVRERTMISTDISRKRWGMLGRGEQRVSNLFVLFVSSVIVEPVVLVLAGLADQLGPLTDSYDGLGLRMLLINLKRKSIIASRVRVRVRVKDRDDAAVFTLSYYYRGLITRIYVMSVSRFFRPHKYIMYVDMTAWPGRIKENQEQVIWQQRPNNLDQISIAFLQ